MNGGCWVVVLMGKKLSSSIPWEEWTIRLRDDGPAAVPTFRRASEIVEFMLMP
jgi:hypothetical protein